MRSTYYYNLNDESNLGNSYDFTSGYSDYNSSMNGSMFNPNLMFNPFAAPEYMTAMNIRNAQAAWEAPYQKRNAYWGNAPQGMYLANQYDKTGRTQAMMNQSKKIQDSLKNDNDNYHLAAGENIYTINRNVFDNIRKGNFNGNEDKQKEFESKLLANNIKMVQERKRSKEDIEKEAAGQNFQGSDEDLIDHLEKTNNNEWQKFKTDKGIKNDWGSKIYHTDKNGKKKLNNKFSDVKNLKKLIDKNRDAYVQGKQQDWINGELEKEKNRPDYRYVDKDTGNEADSSIVDNILTRAFGTEDTESQENLRKSHKYNQKTQRGVFDVQDATSRYERNKHNFISRFLHNTARHQAEDIIDKKTSGLYDEDTDVYTGKKKSEMNAWDKHKRWWKKRWLNLNGYSTYNLSIQDINDCIHRHYVDMSKQYNENKAKQTNFSTAPKWNPLPQEEVDLLESANKKIDYSALMGIKTKTKNKTNPYTEWSIYYDL